MERKPLKRLGAMVAAGAFALALISCKGSTGPNGLNGTNGTNGSNGTNGTSVASVNGSDLTTAAWSALKLQGKVTNLDMTSGTPKVTFLVTDQNGNGISGLGKAGPDGLSQHMAFSIAKLIPASSTAPSRWVNYLFVKPASADGKTAASFTAFPDPETTEGTLVDNLDGTYTYTFNLNISQASSISKGITLTGTQSLTDLDDLTYDTKALHRLIIMVGGAPKGTAVMNPANIIYDFLPSAPMTALPAGTNERQVVSVQACNACHTKLSMHADFFAPAQDTQACVVCHTDQMKFGFADSRTADSTTLAPISYFGQQVTFRQDGVAVPAFPNFIHKIHMGDQLQSTGNALFGTHFDTQYPQDIRNCTTCHTNQAAPAVAEAAPVAPKTADGDNWMGAPSRMACGSCHDSVIFADGTNHGPIVTGTTSGLPQLDDSACASCHTSADVAISHIPVWTPAQSGQTGAQATNPANMPAGAHQVQWNIKSVSVDVNNIPTMVFNFLVDGKPYVFNTNTAAGQDMMTGALTDLNSTTQGPKLFLAFGMTQDGITTPADYNATASWTLSSLWNGTAAKNGLGQAIGTFGPYAADPTYYQVTLTGYPLPANTGVAMMGIGFGTLVQASTNLPVPQTTLLNTQTTFQNVAMSYATGLILPARTQWMNIPVVAGNSIPKFARRQILKDNACASCHGNLGAFTTSSATPNNFHAVGTSGDANNEGACVFCHNVTRTDGDGYSINNKNWIHSIHGASQRTNAYTAHSKTAAGSTFWAIDYPALLNNCEACHVPGSYDFSSDDAKAQLGSMLWDLDAVGKPGTVTFPLSSHSVAVAPGKTPSATAATLSPWVDQTGTVIYGTGWSFAAPTTAKPTWQTTAPVTSTQGVASLVTSPITSACSACHNSGSAISHMTTNGGYFYTQRTQVQNPTVAGTPSPLPNTSNTLVSNEQCLVCHGTGTVLDIKTVHMNF